MNIKFLCYLVLLFLSETVAATTMTGNDFLEYNKPSSDLMAKQYLVGYVAGWYDQLEITHPEIPKCIGPEVKMTQLVDSVSLYLEKNPQMRHKHPVTFISLAIKQQFGC